MTAAEQPDVVDETRVARLAKRWLAADLTMRQAADERDEVGAELTAELQPGQEYRMPDGQGVRYVRAARKFSANRALRIVPPGLLETILVKEVSRELAAKRLPPELYSDCQVASGSPYLRRVT